MRTPACAIRPGLISRSGSKCDNGPLILCPRFNAIAPCFGDLDGDGLPDLISGGSGDIPWLRMVRFDNVPIFEPRGYLEAGGKRIYHEFIHGDDTTFPFAIDWNADGLIDFLIGDGDGYVTHYRNEGSKTEPKFAAGEKLKMADNTPLCVVVPTPEHTTDFEGHSGNRSVPAPADYDGDGKLDLRLRQRRRRSVLLSKHRKRIRGGREIRLRRQPRVGLSD